MGVFELRKILGSAEQKINGRRRKPRPLSACWDKGSPEAHAEANAGADANAGEPNAGGGANANAGPAETQWLLVDCMNWLISNFDRHGHLAYTSDGYVAHRVAQSLRAMLHSTRSPT